MNGKFLHTFLPPFFLYIIFFHSQSVNSQSNSIIIITKSTQIPPNSKSLGKIRSGVGIKNECSYDEQMNNLNEKASKKGANLLFVYHCTHVFPPGKICLSLMSQAYVITNPDSLKRVIAATPDSISGKEYGYLYLYRGKGYEYPGAKNKTFNVVLDSSNKYIITQGCVYAIKITPGNHTLSIENSKISLTVNVEPGQAYYIRAETDKNTSFVPGQIVFTFGGWYNSIKLIEDKRAGKLEYDVVATRETSNEIK